MLAAGQNGILAAALTVAARAASLWPLSKPVHEPMRTRTATTFAVVCALLSACAAAPNITHEGEPPAVPIDAATADHPRATVALPALPQLPPSPTFAATARNALQLPSAPPDSSTIVTLPDETAPAQAPPGAQPASLASPGEPAAQPVPADDQPSTNAAPGTVSSPSLPPGSNASPPPANQSDQQLATAALRDLDHRINLSARQLQKLRHVQALLRAGKTAGAAEVGMQLDREVRTAIRKYKVKPGDTLRGIAHATFGNADLWPLIWRANTKKIPDPAHLTSGIVLEIRPHPTLSEAAAAIAETHRSATP